MTTPTPNAPGESASASGGLAASSASTAISKIAPINITLDHPRLIATDGECIRVFLRKYDQYSNEVRSRARQLSTSTTSSEPVRPVDLKFCVDVDFLESTIALGFIEGVATYDALTDAQVRAFLEDRAKEAKDVVTLDMLDKIIQAELRSDMKNSNAKARMQDLFASYHTILRRNGLQWIVKENQKVAVAHVLSAIRPQSLRDRLESDLAFSQHALRKHFTGFLTHAIKLAEAFQLVDSGPPSKRRRDDGKRSGNGADPPPPSKPGPSKNPKKNGGGGTGGGNNSGGGKNGGKVVPVCLWEPHKKQGIRHLLKDCPECPDAERHRILQERAEEKAKSGPARSTRSQTDGTTGRLAAKQIDMHTSPSCPIVVSDGIASMSATGRCDDGSDDSIASSAVAQQAVLKGIGCLEAITPITIQVALTSSDTAEAFQFSRVWKIPRLVMELSSGRLALTNISFLVSDAALASEDVLIGLPVLQHLGIDSRTLLERNRATLDGTDCSSVPHPSVSKTCGSLGRLMIARHQRVTGREPIDHHDLKPTPSPDPARPRENYFSHKYDEDPFPDPNLLDITRAASDDADDQAIEDMIQRAVDNGIEDEFVQPLRDLVKEFRPTFQTGFSSVPSKVDPLHIELTRDARPVKVKLRNYSPSQRAFMQKVMDELIHHGIMYPNPSSAWASAPHIVPKPGPAEWRFTVDLSPVNKFTVPYQFPMPVIEHELGKTAKSTKFAGVDFTHSYWQLLLAEASRECQSIITPDGIFTPTRVLHGTTNAVLHLQSFLTTKLPSALLARVLLWVDDCLFHEASTASLVQNLRRFFEFCTEWNWKLNPRKCNLYMTEARWCGRIISAAGIRHDPSKLDGLTNMECPTTGGQLQIFLCAMQWLRSAIANFQALTKDLHDILERVYAKAGKRTKRAVARVPLAAVGWTDAHTDAFDACKQAILHRTTLAHRDEAKRLCIYTDASDSHWSGIVTQVSRHQQSLPHMDQDHEPLAFHSGRFSKTQVGWSTLEKEAFAVMASIERSHWLASCADGFDLFTDHNNLIFIFDPLAVMPDIGQATTRKVLRWAVRLSLYNYVCIHIRGDDNVWADLMTRWSIPMTIRRLVNIPPLPSTFVDFDWPTGPSLRSSQDAHEAHRPASAHVVDGIWRLPSGAAWIPDNDDSLQLRLCIIAHTGTGGHRSANATKAALSQDFSWLTMSEDVDLFVSSCIHCLSTTGGGKVPRPFGPALFGTKPNELVQFDYIELGPSRTGEKYVLMVRDDHSGYAWFYPASTTDSETAANALLDWSAAFGAPLGLMSDGPTHFKNETLRLLAKGLRSPHHFTLPYCPWANGAVERLGKELLRVARAVLSELQMRHDDWPQLVPLFQSALNNAPSPQRKNVAPITAFTGRPSSNPVTTFLRSSDCRPVSVTAAQLEAAGNVGDLVKFMDNLHPLVHEHTKKQRERIRDARAKGQLPNFVEGDYVLVAREDFFEGEKLCLRWRGPRRVVKALSDYVFRVEDLRNGKVDDMHGTRLKFYRDSDLDEKVIMSHVLSSETGMPVARLLRLVDQAGDLFVAVRWKGLSAAEDTLEPLQRVFEDVPQLTRKLLNRKATPAALKAKAFAALGL